MLGLLREDQVAEAFRKAMENVPEACVAVAYWGNGSIERLGLKKGAKIRIICNLDHPGCNPDVIASIKQMGLKVRSHYRLHAKVYLTPTIAIVGSSNASTNGLTVEGNEALGWIEANVGSDDPKLIQQMTEFFESIWNHRETKRVTDADIKAAQKRRLGVPLSLLNCPGAKTLLAACREHPALFKNVVVAAYKEDLDEDAKQQFDDQLPARSRSSLWGYQFGRIPDDTWIVDLNCMKARPEVSGCAKSIWCEAKRKNKDPLTIARRGVITIGNMRFTLAQDEKALLIKAANAIMSEAGTGVLPLYRAICIADNLPKHQLKPSKHADRDGRKTRK